MEFLIMATNSINTATQQKIFSKSNILSCKKFIPKGSEKFGLKN